MDVLRYFEMNFIFQRYFLKPTLKIFMGPQRRPDGKDEPKGSTGDQRPYMLQDPVLGRSLEFAFNVVAWPDKVSDR